MSALFVDDGAGAKFSDCRRWRYRLWRMWEPSLPTVNFLMLNPSTADEVLPDNTITRCINYVRAWGFGTLVVTNLFAWRSTDPAAMMAADDPVGPENNRHILDVASTSVFVVCAWGVHGSYRNRAAEVLALLRAQNLGYRLRHLGLTQGGHPKHPLYLKKSLTPSEFT